MSKPLSNSLLRAWLLVAVAATGAPHGAAGADQLEIRQLEAGGAAAEAGLRVGDRLIAWERREAGRRAAGGPFESVFDLWQVETEEAPRGGLRVQVASLPARPRWHELAPRPWGLEVVLTRPETAHPAARSALAADAAEGVAEAGALWHEALAAAVELPPLERSHLAFRFAEHLLAHDRFDDALAHHEAALRLRRSLAPQSLATAASLDETGIAAWYLGDKVRAEGLWSEALALREGLLPGSLLVAKSLNNLALLKPLEERLDLSRRAIEIRRRLDPGGAALANQLTNLANALENAGRLDEAEAALGEAEELLAQHRPRDRRRGVNQISLGLLSQQRGDLAAAEKAFRTAIELFESDAPQSFDLADAYGFLGRLLVASRQSERAEVYLDRALDLFREVAPRNGRIVPTLLNRGLAAKQQGRGDDARRYYGAAVAQGRAVGDDNGNVGVALNNLGSLAEAEEDFAAAEDYYRQAIRSLEAQQNVAVELARSRMNLGRCLLRRGAREDAEHLLQAALEVQRERSPGSLEQAMSLAALAQLAEGAGDTDLAAERFAAALDALEADRHLVTGGDLARARGQTQVSPMLYDYVELLIARGDAAGAFAVSERLRARAFRQQLAERSLRLPEGLPQAQAEELRRLREDHDRVLADLAEEGDPQRREDLRRELEARREAQRVILAAAHRRAPAPSPAAAEVEPPPAGEVVLSFLVTADRAWLLVVTAEATTAHRLASDGATLAQRTEALLAAIERREHLERPRYRRLAQELGDTLLGPAAAALTNAERVVVLPDGGLHRLPFGGLIAPQAAADDEPTGARRRYWIEDVAITIAPSYSALLELRQRPPAMPRRLISFGLSQAPTAGPRNRPSEAAAPLPHAPAEARRIADLFAPAAESLLEARATEERFRSLGSAAIVHFASHAWADDRFPLDSGLAFARPPGERAHGLLQAWEILEQVRLEADLVTLSGCQTGLGRSFAGEGLLGLTRALQIAGARSVVASLWRVGDASTRPLMERFYRHVGDGRSFGDGLRQAQLDVLKADRVGDLDLSAPYHWAGFQLYGDDTGRWTTAP